MIDQRRINQRVVAIAGAVASGVAVLCSDHTPIDGDGKQLPFPEALPGATGLELLLPLTLRWAAEDGRPLPEALARIQAQMLALLHRVKPEAQIGGAAH